MWVCRYFCCILLGEIFILYLLICFYLLVYLLQCTLINITPVNVQELDRWLFSIYSPWMDVTKPPLMVHKNKNSTASDKSMHSIKERQDNIHCQFQIVYAVCVTAKPSLVQKTTSCLLRYTVRSFALGVGSAGSCRLPRPC